MKAEGNLDRLLRLWDSDKRELSLKMSDLEKKLAMSTEEKNSTSSGVKPAKKKRTITVRRGKLKTEEQLKSNPNWDSDYSLSEDDWIVLKIPKGDRSFVRVDFKRLRQ